MSVNCKVYDSQFQKLKTITVEGADQDIKICIHNGSHAIPLLDRKYIEASFPKEVLDLLYKG